MKTAIVGTTQRLTAEALSGAIEALGQTLPPTRLFFTTASTPFPDSYAQRISALLGDGIDVYDRQGRIFVGGKQIGRAEPLGKMRGDTTHENSNSR